MRPTWLPLLLLLPACVDNSGGPPPAGDEVAFTDLDDPGFSCGNFEDRAWLLRTDADVDALEADCASPFGDADALRAAVVALAGGDVLVYFTLQKGGCIGEHDIASVYLDGAVLRPWIYQADSSWGRSAVACTADIGEAAELLSVSGADGASSAELTIGTYNPDLAGAPALPG